MFNIAIMGCGVVGSGVADILMERSKYIGELYATDVNLVKILDIRDLTGTPYAQYTTKDIDEIWNDSSIKLIVVTIGGLDLAYQICKKALISGRHVVTSNKEVVAAYGRELMRISYVHGVRFMFEASVGGGIPVIRPLHICLAANKIYEIQGIVNGTTNFMLTRMSRDCITFDQVLAEAQSKGYAEANPSADIDGFDAARKIAILSSIAYGTFVDYGKIQCSGIRDITCTDFELAAKAGYTIKLIASSRLQDGKVCIGVSLALVPVSNILASVNSVYNAILLKGVYTGDTLFYGQGAGKLPTADAIVGDIIEVLGMPKLKSLPDYVNSAACIESPDNYPCRWFVRFESDSDDKTSLDEMLILIENIFDHSTVFAGMSEFTPNTGAFITGYCTKAELIDGVDRLKAMTALKCVEYIKSIE